MPLCPLLPGPFRNRLFRHLLSPVPNHVHRADMGKQKAAAHFCCYPEIRPLCGTSSCNGVLLCGSLSSEFGYGRSCGHGFGPVSGSKGHWPGSRATGWLLRPSTLMNEVRFSKWCRWNEREDLEGLHFPGVYVIAYSAKAMAGRRFSWRREIIYIGMTNAVSGLKGRLKQFDNTVRGKQGHGGADRVRYKHPEYDQLARRLYVCTAPFRADVTSNQPSDLRVMGEVAKFEYSCLARFVRRFGELPEFNNKKAPKASKMHRQK